MEGIAALTRALEALVVGQDEARTGLLLALLAGEHAYLEGPPGCAKTRLAEGFAAAAGARTAAIRFHRDTREADLLGETRLVRQRSPASGTERLRQTLAPGPVLEAEILILDDLARAPGEALGPLLRMLGDRRALGRVLPLETAVATGVPPELGLYLDPLEPTQLDRFAIQVRVRGLLYAQSWADARSLLDADPRETERSVSAVCDTAGRAALRTRAASLPLDPRLPAALLALVQKLDLRTRSHRRAGEGMALLSDRSFSRAALRVIRAHALLSGRERAELADLSAVRFMLACRVPEDVRDVFDQLVEQVMAEMVGGRELLAGGRRGHGPGQAGHGRVADQPDATAPTTDVAGVAPGPTPRATGESDAADTAVLLRALEGRLQRSRIERDEDPGGQPRSMRPLRRLDELLDADATEALLYTEGRWPGVPRAYRRERRNRGGRLAVLRDVSASMEGRLSRWAGEVVTGLVRSCLRHHMRIGYVEFNHLAESDRGDDGRGSFFHRRYSRVLALAATRRAEGRTNYEAPLRVALEALKGGPRGDRHVVLLTDGVPVVGDPAVRNERALARRLGVSVHTVFLGLGECPPVLDSLSRETGGLRFVARPSVGGQLRVRPREAALG